MELSRVGNGIEWCSSGFGVGATAVFDLGYINYLDDGIVNSTLKFADDTKIFGAVSDLGQHHQLQDDLNTLPQWSKDWQMLFHVDKCKG